MHRNRLLLVVGLLLPFASLGCDAIENELTSQQTNQQKGQQTCQQLKDAYANAYPAALVCVPGATDQCQQQAKSDSDCNCEGAVQDATQLDALVDQMTAQGCLPKSLPACPCVYLGAPTCVANDAGGGTCTYSSLR